MAPSIPSALIFFLGATMAAPLTSNPTLFARALNPTCAPGGNFDLSIFNLQLPTGTPGKVDQVSASKLQGCSGWQDKAHFFTSPSGSLVMKVPGSKDSAGCMTTPNSKHCRTELRESKPNSWSPHKALNRLRVRVTVKKADDSKYGTVIGQVKVDDKISKKPVAELFYNKSGVLTLGVSQIPDVSSLKMTKVGQVAVGKTFGYEIRYEGNKLSVSIDGGAFQTLSTGELPGANSYFKVGNYNQGDSPSEVVFDEINVQHK